MDLDYKSLDWAQQLLLCKDLTERFGVLHEAQILQLKGWPILKYGAKKSEALVNIEDKTLTFNWEGAANIAKKDFGPLRWGIDYILGKGWKMEINLNGRLIFPVDVTPPRKAGTIKSIRKKRPGGVSRKKRR